MRLSNPARRNALGLSVLRSLRSQLTAHLTSRRSGRLLLLPPFAPRVLRELEADADAVGRGHVRAEHPHAHSSSSSCSYRWLVDASEWRREREGLPDVLVLRSDSDGAGAGGGGGKPPVFSSGHDLRELAALPPEQVRETFALCADVMALVRRSPAVVVCAVDGLATAAGCQLALTADVAVALATTPFSLPGMAIGLPCSSPATALSRRVPPARAYRMFATAEPVVAADLGGAVDVVPVPDRADAAGAAAAAAFEARVDAVVRRLAEQSPAQPQALGKWAFWTQLGMGGGFGSGDEAASGEDDPFQEAARWAGRVMALHARADDAREGIRAFLAKQTPQWVT